MQEVEVRITSVCPPGGQGGIRAYASATIGGCFGVRGIKIVEGGRDGLFVSMPSRKTVDGYSEVCFPVTAEFREQLYGKVLGAYRQVMREVQTAAVQGYGSPPPGPGEEKMEEWEDGKMEKSGKESPHGCSHESMGGKDKAGRNVGRRICGYRSKNPDRSGIGGAASCRAVCIV